MKHTAGQIVTDEEYKERLLLLMDSIDSFCRKHNLQYYMLGGTMLGAVRHHGIIPWDDDIDIGMKRSDYEYFCKEYKDETRRNYQAISLYTSKDYYLPAAKVIDTDISVYEFLNQAIEIGAYVDVFPLDYVKQNANGTFDYFEKGKIIRQIESLKRMKIMKGRSPWKNLLILLGHLVCPCSVHSIVSKYEKKAIKYSQEEKTDWLANLHGAWKEKEIVRSELFESVCEYEFDGRKLYGIKDYDSYLKHLYGDYMQLPPEEKRITHHNYQAVWK